MIGKFRNYSWGVLLGLGAAGILYWFTPALRQSIWLDAPVALSCVVVGMLIERAVRYFFGWDVNSRLTHLAATREAERELAKLEEYVRRDIISKEVAKGIAARIARRDVAGGVKPRAPRGPYKRRRVQAQQPPAPIPEPPLGSDETPPPGESA